MWICVEVTREPENEEVRKEGAGGYVWTLESQEREESQDIGQRRHSDNSYLHEWTVNRVDWINCLMLSFHRDREKKPCPSS